MLQREQKNLGKISRIFLTIIDIKMPFWYGKSMKKFVTILILVVVLSTPSLAKPLEKDKKITDKEIVERLIRLEEGQKILKEELRIQIGNVNKRIDDLRVEMNDRFASVNKRIDDLDKKLNKRIDDVNKRIDDLRAEMNHRFNTLEWMLGLFIAISLAILSFVLKMQWQMQRKQASLETTLSTQREELAFLRTLIEKLIPSEKAA